jgi:hypothetical protein
MLRLSTGTCLVLVAVACGPAAPAATETTPPPDDGRQVCEAVMRRTRECGDLYLPALLRTRARYDQPPGIAARYEAEGEEALMTVAREEFERDWSEEGIAAHCDELDRREPAARAAIVERERTCLPQAGQCAAFVECNMTLLANRWGAEASAPPAPASP